MCIVSTLLASTMGIASPAHAATPVVALVSAPGPTAGQDRNGFRRPPKPPRIPGPNANPRGPTLKNGLRSSKDRAYRAAQGSETGSRKDDQPDTRSGSGATVRVDLEDQLEALGKIRKRIDEKQRRAEASLKRHRNPESPRAQLDRFKIDHYEDVLRLAGDYDQALRKGGRAPAPLTSLPEDAAARDGEEKKPKPKRGSFEDLRARFLRAEAKDFAISSHATRVKNVKSIYEKFRHHAEALSRE